jgi:hypothetical protein
MADAPQKRPIRSRIGNVRFAKTGWWRHSGTNWRPTTQSSNQSLPPSRERKFAMQRRARKSWFIAQQRSISPRFRRNKCEKADRGLSPTTGLVQIKSMRCDGNANSRLVGRALAGLTTQPQPSSSCASRVEIPAEPLHDRERLAWWEGSYEE